MLQLDPRTVVWLFIVSAVFMALLLTFAFRTRMDSVIKFWIASLFTQAIGWSCVISNGSSPAWVSILLAAACIAIGHTFLQMAVCRFYEIPTPYYWPFWPLIIFPLALYIWQEQKLAQALVNATIGLQLGIASIVFLTRRDRWVGVRSLIATSAALAALATWLRSYVMLTAPSVDIFVLTPGKPQSIGILVAFTARLAFMLGFLLLIEGRRYDKANQLATFDSLTGGLNRRTFLEYSERELTRHHRNGQPLALLILDIDHFKSINDNFGHQAGDVVLSRIASSIQGVLRQTDLFGRYGGEEFCVLAVDTPAEGAMILAERIRESIASLSFPVAGKTLEITTSIGLTTAAHIGVMALDELIAQADTALYKAKNAGRNRVIQHQAEQVPCPI